MHLVRKINYIEGYKISLTFNDRITKIVDIEPYLDKGIFLLLRNHEYFKKVSLSGSTIVWPNEADFCPDVLYEIGIDEVGIHKQSKKVSKVKAKISSTLSKKRKTR